MSSVGGFEYQTGFCYPLLSLAYLVNSCELVLFSSIGSLQFSEVKDNGPQYLKIEYAVDSYFFFDKKLHISVVHLRDVAVITN